MTRATKDPFGFTILLDIGSPPFNTFMMRPIRRCRSTASPDTRNMGVKSGDGKMGDGLSRGSPNVVW